MPTLPSNFKLIRQVYRQAGAGDTAIAAKFFWSGSGDDPQLSVDAAGLFQFYTDYTGGPTKVTTTLQGATGVIDSASGASMTWLAIKAYTDLDSSIHCQLLTLPSSNACVTTAYHALQTDVDGTEAIKLDHPDGTIIYLDESVHLGKVVCVGVESDTYTAGFGRFLTRATAATVHQVVDVTDDIPRIVSLIDTVNYISEIYAANSAAGGVGAITVYAVNGREEERTLWSAAGPASGGAATHDLSADPLVGLPGERLIVAYVPTTSSTSPILNVKGGIGTLRD